MEDKEQQNNEQSFIKEQRSKGEKQAKERAKKNGIKAIITAMISQIISIILNPIIMAVIIVSVMIAGFVDMLGSDESKNASDAKAAAVTYTLGGGTGEDGSTNSTNKIKISYNNGIYTISDSYSNDKTKLKEIKEKLTEIGMDISDFTDFEIGIIGALMENGLDIHSYTEEKLRCLPLFIKVEACTRYLDLRPNSEKFDSQGNYQPQKLEDLKENEVPGVILVKRTNTNEKTPRNLEYIDLNQFNSMLANKNQDVLNYFTIDKDNNLLVAKWEYIKVEVDGEYPSGVEGVTPREEYIISEKNVEKIPYSEYVKKYTMPFDFLVQLLVISDEPDFCRELTNIASGSQIVINIQEEETTTITEDEQAYTVWNKEEKTVTYDVSSRERGNTSASSQSEKKETKTETLEERESISQTYNVKVKTTSKAHTYTSEIKEADTWLGYYLKDYKEPVREVIPGGEPDIVEMPGKYGNSVVTNGSLDDNKEEIQKFEKNKEKELMEQNKSIVTCKVEKIEIKSSQRIDEKHINTTIQTEKYTSDPNPTISTDIYTKDENGKFVKFLSVYDKYAYTRDMMDSASGWLFDMMEDNSNTEDLVEPIKYLLHIYDGKDYGVTEIDTSIFKPSEFKFNSGNGTDWWWPIGSSETREVNGVLYADDEPAQIGGLSGFGVRELEGEQNAHKGLDISGGRYTNIIAAKPGVVTYVEDGHEDGWYISNSNRCMDGGGWGNYISVRLDDGKLVRYAHLQKGTIKVKIGDTVEQGQLIGQMGTSGSSTGVHLHFEIRDVNDIPLNPMEFVNPDNPRPSASSIQKWLWEIEGGSKYINGKEWTVFNPEGSDDTMNLAHGMVIADYDGADSWYPGIIPGKVHAGDKITEEQANAIWDTKIKGFSDAIDTSCVRYGVTLASHQKDALISYIYRTGYGRGQHYKLVSAYSSGGNEGLWNYMKETYDERYPEGTKKRIAEEYELFVKGDYNYNPGSGTTKYDKFCSNPNS